MFNIYLDGKFIAKINRWEVKEGLEELGFEYDEIKTPFGTVFILDGEEFNKLEMQPTV